jgi:DNA-binding LacI/PurR family transcriptional regulator
MTDRKSGRDGPLMSDVARAAGVATSTVSRALANPGRVNEKTRARIVAAAKDLGYTLNVAARNLRTRSSRVVMIVLPGARFFFGASQVVLEVTSAIDTQLLEQDYGLLIGNLDRTESTERRIIDLAFGGTIDGVIMLSSPIPQADGRTLLDSGLPVVSMLFDKTAEGIGSVVTNDRAAMREAAQHLIELGHRRFFYLSAPPDNYHEIERFAGLCEAVRLAGLGADAITRFEGNFNFESGIAGAQRFLAISDRPSAVLCCNDDMAIAFMKAVRDAGVSVPQDISVIGFDGAAVGAFCAPAMTTMQQPTTRMGRYAANMLLDLIAQRPLSGAFEASLHVENSNLLLRASTGPAPR